VGERVREKIERLSPEDKTKIRDRLKDRPQKRQKDND
jgi:hypothetical protein